MRGPARDQQEVARSAAQPGPVQREVDLAVQHEERLGAVDVPVRRGPRPPGGSVRSISEKSPPVCAATALNAMTLPRAVRMCPAPGGTMPSTAQAVMLK